jgi:hypothetical protein
VTSIKFTTALAVAFGLTVAALADDAKPAANVGTLPLDSSKQGVTYATDIKPIFDQSCVKCHSGEKPKAKLRLDSLDGALKGGRDGKVIVPGDITKSPLVLRIAHLTNDQDLWMPPLDNKANIRPLTPEQIGLIRAWIDQGAK